MIELRWLLDPEHPQELKDTAPLDAYTLQYRVAGKEPQSSVYKWSEWKDVPFVSEDE